MRDDGPQGTPRQQPQARDPEGTTPRSDDSDGPGLLVYLYDLVSSVAIVIVIGGLLFTASGIWPPMVAVESPSMEPVLERGDLVFVMEGDRFPGPGAQEDTGVVTARTGRDNGYRSFEGYGDVIVFKPDGSEHDTPVIHRAMFWVEENENWVESANPEYLPDNTTCEGLSNDICPAKHAGFITKGDANPHYDQVANIANRPTKPEWVIGTAEFSVPYLGNIRLNAAGASPGNATAN